MNKSEFNTIGALLFGKSWKKDMTRTLNMSENSNTVAKIATGKVRVTTGVKQDILIALKNKARLCIQAIEIVSNPTKILVTQAEMSIVCFDLNGVQVLNVFDEHSAYSEIGILINNADIGLNPQEYEMQSLLIAEYAALAIKENNQQILIDAINQYFDLSLFNQDEIFNLD